jgi:hypothetical protein
MQLIFTKGQGKYDTMDVVRADGKSERIDCPKQRIIPHDMVHYAVEHTLQQRGFLSRVRAGEQATFQMQAEAQSDGIERLVEVFQGDAWSGGASSASEMLDLYQVTCAERACPPLQIAEADIAAVRAEMARLTVAWDAVAVGATLTLAF